MQQGGMMGGIEQARREAFDPQGPKGMGLPPQGNNPQTQGPKPQGIDKGYEIPINMMKHPGGIGGMMGGGEGSLGYNQQTGIGQQGGLMGQPLSPEQQQIMELQNKKKRQMELQAFSSK
jgi:hypothetical protein